MNKVFCICAIVLALTATALPAPAADTPDALKPVEAIGNFMDDAGITGELKLRLAAEKGLDSSAISVTTENAVVELEGVVDSSAQSELAEKIARNLSNVKSVRNNLAVRH